MTRILTRDFTLALLLTLALDQLSKHWVVFGLGMIDRAPITLTDWFSIVMVWNRGVSFGMLSHSEQDWSAYALVALAVGISVLLVRAARKATARVEVVAYGMVVGGALGNAIDRIRFGAVADFIFVHWKEWGWPAFNIADAAICIGVGLLLLRLGRDSKVQA